MSEFESDSDMKESPESGALFITIVICVVLIVLAGGLAYNLGQSRPFTPKPEGTTLKLAPTDIAKNTHLDGAEVTSLVNLANGYVRLDIHPDANFIIPQGSSLEAFLVDAGTVGDFGTSSETTVDEFYGPSLSNKDADDLLDKAPYALSIGRIKQDTKTKDYYIEFNIQNSLIPYDRIVLTLESEGDRIDYDPRPGAVIFQAEIPNNIKPRKSLTEANEPSNPENK